MVVISLDLCGPLILDEVGSRREKVFTQLKEGVSELNLLAKGGSANRAFHVPQSGWVSDKISLSHTYIR